MYDIVKIDNKGYGNFDCTFKSVLWVCDLQIKEGGGAVIGTFSRYPALIIFLA